LAERTDWSRDFILWELPFITGLGLQLTYLRKDGAWCVPIEPPKPPVTDAGVDDLLTPPPEHE
jgi:hypothetical protein